MALRKYSFDESYFDVLNTPEQAYWLGFIAADGYISHDEYRLAVNLKKQDSDHLLKFANCIKSDRPLRTTVKNCDGNTYYGAELVIDSRHVVSSLMYLGLTPRKSLTLKPWDGPPDLMPAYWRGIFDGDGCIGKYQYHGRPVWHVGVVGSRDCVDGFGQWGREICGTKAIPCRKAGVWQWACTGTRKPKLLAHELEIAYPSGLDRKQKLLEELSEFTPLRNFSK